MKMDDIKTIAKNMGLKISKLKKAQLINLIQTEEGNNACYATDAIASCGQDACLWRDDCLKATK